MTSTTIDTGSIYLTNGSLSGDTIITSGDQVVIRLSNGDAGPEEYNGDNSALIMVDDPILATSASGGSGVPNKRIKNLLRLSETRTFCGYLEEDGVTNPLTKVANIILLFHYGGVITAVCGKSSASQQEIFTGALNKYQIQKTPGRVVSSGQTIDGSSPERNYKATVTIMLGVDL